MKLKYVVMIIALILLTGWYSYSVLSSSTGLHPQLGDLLQGLAIMVALVAGIIALATADPKTKKIIADMELDSLSNCSSFSKADLSAELVTKYASYPDPFESCRVNLKFRNRSGITLKKPVITLTLPNERQHPVQGQPPLEKTEFRSNMFTTQHDLKVFTGGQFVILSNSLQPYWNDGDELRMWVRVACKVTGSDSFSLSVSINAENAEGISKSIQIKY